VSQLNTLVVAILRLSENDLTLIENLSLVGAKARQLPMQRIRPYPDDNDEITDQIRRIDEFDKVIFVSSNATRLALQWLDRFNLASLIDGRCFAVGPSSAELLYQRYIRVKVPSSLWSSAGLLLLSALQNVDGQKIIIFRGEGGLAVLGDTLSARGAVVEYCELYQRQLEQRFKKILLELVEGENPVVLVAHSGGILDALLAVAGPNYRERLEKLPIVVPGSRLRKYALAIGFQTIIESASAGSRHMERAIIDWYTRGR
jgi:uroporphyrinogen-III synthase